MTVEMILLSHVDVGTGRRSVSRPAVKELAASIAEIGLLSPIAVYPVGDAYELIAGRHRIEAVKSLGWTEIPAILLDLDEVQREMAEIDENLVRCQLNAADTARQTARRKELYLRLHPETAAGVRQAAGTNRKLGRGNVSAESALTFVADTAAKTGASTRTVHENVQIGESIPDDVFEAIEGTPLADSKTDLLNLARLSEDEQRDAIADADLSDKASVRSEIERRRSPRHTSDPVVGDDYVEDVNQDPGDDITVDADPDAPLTDRERTEGGWPEPSADDAGAAASSGPALTVTPSDWPGTVPPGGDVPPVAVAAPDAGPTASVQPAAPATRTNSSTSISAGAGKRGSAPSARMFSAPTLDAGDVARTLLDMPGWLENLVENADASQKQAIRQAFGGTTQPAPSTAPRKPSEIVAEIKALPIGLQRSAISSVLSILADDLPADDQRLFLPRLETLLTTIREGKGAVGIRALAGGR